MESIKTTPPKIDALEQKDQLNEIAELIKKEGVGEVIIHGKDIYRDGKKTGDLAFHSDLDARMALTLLNDFNTLPPEKLYTEGSVTSIVSMGGSKKDLEKKIILPYGIKPIEKEKKGVRIFLDVGGEWIKIEKKDGEMATVYLDHHGAGKKDPTSATKMVYDMLDKSGLLKEKPEWLTKFVEFVNDFDNLSYRDNKNEKGEKILTEKYFRYVWPRTPYAIADEIPLEIMLDLYKSGKIKDLSKPLTRSELEGEIGKTIVEKIVDKKGNPVNITLKDICRKKAGEAYATTVGISQAERYAKENRLNLDTRLGKIIFHNYPKVKSKEGKIYTNKILNHLAFLGAYAKGYDGVVFWNPKNESRRFFININNPKTTELAEELTSIAPGTTDVRGTFIFAPKDAKGVKNITQEQFLNILDPKILENATVIKGEGNKESEYVLKGGDEPEAAEKVNLVFEEEIPEEKVEKKPGEKIDPNKLTEETKANPELNAQKIYEAKIKLEIELQAKLGEARTKYAEGYKNFMEERRKSTGFFKGLKRKILGEKVPEEEIPEELKKLEEEYNKVIIEYGQNMYKNKSDILLDSGGSKELIAAELERYKQNEIFNKIIIEEQEKLATLKAENLPPKEKALWKKALDSYLKQPRWKKILISTGLSVAVFASIAPGTIAAAGGLGAYIVARLTRGAVGSIAGQTAAGAYEWAVDEKYTERKESALEELQEKFKGKDSDADIAKYKKEYAEILEREAKSKRNRLLHKAMVGIVAGGAASFGAGHEIGHLINGTEEVIPASGTPSDHVSGVGKINPEEHIFKTEQVGFSSRGAIQTIENLKTQISHDYPDLSKAPHSVQEFMKTNSTQEAIKLGFYDPNNPSGAESAMVIKGSTLEFDAKGNLLYHDIRTGEAHTLIHEQGNIEATEQYHGKMFDSDYSASTPHPEEIKTGGNIDENIKGNQTNTIPEKPIVPQEIHPSTENDLTNGKTTENILTNNDNHPGGIISKENPFGLPTEKLAEVDTVYGENIKQIFPTKNAYNAWLMIENSDNTTADHVIKMTEETVKPEYKPLVSYIQKLHNATGLDPREGNWIQAAETNKEFITRALQKAAELGKLDEVKY